MRFDDPKQVVNPAANRVEAFAHLIEPLAYFVEAPAYLSESSISVLHLLIGQANDLCSFADVAAHGRQLGIRPKLLLLEFAHSFFQLAQFFVKLELAVVETLQRGEKVFGFEGWHETIPYLRSRGALLASQPSSP